MANQRKKREKKVQQNFDGDNIRFIVPMPGKSAWHTPSPNKAFKKFHKFNELAGDLALEDYQAQFLLQREYLID